MTTDHKYLWKIRLGWFLIGILIGAYISFHYFSQELESLYWEKTELDQELTQTEERVSKLEEELRNMEEQWSQYPPQSKVKKTDIVVDYDNTQVELAIEEFCQEIASEVIGHQVSQLEPNLIYQLFDKREVSINDSKYKIEVDSLIITEELTVWVTPKELD
ncbi:hypothetical protein [Natranaerobius trueperi]|uniref:Sporulation membrane protein YtrI C-terminal domain-containing protein n=1 Tax=Natranaerobius trueperi TaxID=759412 RepID=A0A226C2R6_9FIRM|nr:hypothetical protein [Natranaerobius trueperi]OWZ84697.1 hypothetical protein CDO51_01335 [Natranaerobius trueperi]